MKRSIIEIKRFGALVVLLIGLIGLQGCATGPVPTDYIGHDVELMQDPKDASLLWWENPDLTGTNTASLCSIQSASGSIKRR
jgi:hypothetical protein